MPNLSKLEIIYNKMQQILPLIDNEPELLALIGKMADYNARIDYLTGMPKKEPLKH